MHQYVAAGPVENTPSIASIAANCARRSSGATPGCGRTWTNWWTWNTRCRFQDATEDLPIPTLLYEPEQHEQGGKFLAGIKSVEQVRKEANLAGILTHPAGKNGHLAPTSQVEKRGVKNAQTPEQRVLRCHRPTSRLFRGNLYRKSQNNGATLMNVNRSSKITLKACVCATSRRTVWAGTHSCQLYAAGNGGVTDWREVTRHRMPTTSGISCAVWPPTPSEPTKSVAPLFCATGKHRRDSAQSDRGRAVAQVENLLPKRILTPGEVRKLIDAPDVNTLTGLRDRAIFELFYSCGIRRHEIHKLTLADVDIKNGFVRVNLGKGGKDRVVPIGESACQALARYLAETRSVWIKDRRRSSPTDAFWLSAVPPHEPLGIEAIPHMVRRYAKSVLGRTVSPHVWRHTCATHLVSNGANIVYVQRLLGHTSLETTQVYTRVSVPDLKKALARAHPRSRRRATATAPALTREAAAQMQCSHKQTPS